MRALRHHPGRRRLPRAGPARPQCTGAGHHAAACQRRPRGACAARRHLTRPPPGRHLGCGRCGAARVMRAALARPHGLRRRVGKCVGGHACQWGCGLVLGLVLYSPSCFLRCVPRACQPGLTSALAMMDFNGLKASFKPRMTTADPACVGGRRGSPPPSKHC